MKMLWAVPETYCFLWTDFANFYFSHAGMDYKNEGSDAQSLQIILSPLKSRELYIFRLPENPDPEKLLSKRILLND